MKHIISTGRVKSDLQVAADIAKMEAAADFNGIVIQTTYQDPVAGRSFLLNHISVPYAIPYELLQPSEERLSGTIFTKFKSNFIRMNIAEPGLTWLMNDVDRDIFVHNCAMAARLARKAGMLGIFIDTEAYSGSMFWRFLGIALEHPGLPTFAEYEAKYYDTGLRMGREFRREFCDITLAIAVSFEQLRKVAATDLPTDRYGLLPSFLNGLYDGLANSATATIVNVMEDGYSNRIDADFDYDLAIQQQANVPYLTSRNYSNVHAYGMSTWCDYPGTGFNFTDVSKNYNTPKGFEANLEMCLSRLDWVFNYSQQLDWLDPVMGVNAPPVAYVEALSRAMRKRKEVKGTCG